MRRIEYKSKYRTFSGYLHDFSDPSDDDVSDEDIARRLRADWPVSERISMFEELIPEAGRMHAWQEELARLKNPRK